MAAAVGAELHTGSTAAPLHSARTAVGLINRPQGPRLTAGGEEESPPMAAVAGQPSNEADGARFYVRGGEDSSASLWVI